MTLSSIVSTPYRAAASCLQHPALNKKNLIKATIVIGTVAAIGTLILLHSNKMAAINHCLYQSTGSLKFDKIVNPPRGYYSLPFGGTSCSAGTYSCHNICPTGYKEFVLDIANDITNPINKKTVYKQVADFINNATANGFGIFSAYAYSSIISYDEGSRIQHAKVIICRQTAYSLFQQAFEGLCSSFRP